MRLILNLSRTPATPSQCAAGMRDMSDAEARFLLPRLSFDAPPSAAARRRRADEIAAFVTRITVNPAYRGVRPLVDAHFQAHLEDALWEHAAPVVHSFSDASGEHVCWMSLGGPEESQC